MILQGVCSPFFAVLSDILARENHEIVKINFNAGDVAYWMPRRSVWFRRNIDCLPTFLDEVYLSHGITDQILFGDARPMHVSAIKTARMRDIRNHVFEEGYYRPYWITLEREGVNSRSLLPKDAQWFMRASEALPLAGPVLEFQSAFMHRALHDVFYRCSGILNPLVFPQYRNHVRDSAAVEYFGYMTRLPMMRYYKARDSSRVGRLISKHTGYYLLPLQLNSDFQVRNNSCLNTMPALIKFVMSSFAKFAPRHTQLLIKNHPLDTGLGRFGRVVSRFAREFDVEGRVKYFEAGNLDLMVQHAKGVITLNSTTGFTALANGRPTKCLGDSIYNLSGLTFQGSLDDFWVTEDIPDQTLYNCFRNVVMATTQVNGGFYCPKGIELAARSSSALLTSDVSPLKHVIDNVSL